MHHSNQYLRILSSLFLLSTVCCFSPSSTLPFLRASDMSYQPVLDCEGACSPYRFNTSSSPTDALTILKESNWNAVRVRVWVNPLGNSLNETYANLTHVAKFAQRIVRNDLYLWIDLHFSDTWADPGHQTKPAAWINYSIDELVSAVYNHTYLVMSTLIAQGTPPTVIAIGNEIDSGMLWALKQQPCTDGAYIWGPCDNWPTFGRLLASGIKAVRDTAPSTIVMIHSSQGSKLSDHQYGVHDIVEFYTNVSKYGADDYDAIGLSFYPHWGAGNTTNVLQLTNVSKAIPNKLIFIAETAVPYEDCSDPNEQFPCTPTGQLQYLQSIYQYLSSIGMNGVSWWGGEYYNQPTGAGHTALFDTNGVALPVLTNSFSIDTHSSKNTNTMKEEEDPSLLDTLRNRIIQQQIPVPNMVATADYNMDYFLSVLDTRTFTFTDIDYTDNRAASWPSVNHTIRTLSFAAIVLTPNSKYYNSSLIQSYAYSLLSWWLQHDMLNSNWWDNQIGVPKFIGPTAIILQSLVNSSQAVVVEQILLRAVTRGWTAANLIWQAVNRIYLGVFQSNITMVTEYATIAYTGISVSTFPQDGIQADGAFFQHGPQIYNGGYGADYTASVLSLIPLTANTSIALNNTVQLTDFANFLVDGELRTIFYPPIDDNTPNSSVILPPRYDIMVVGRGLSRPQAGEYIGLSGALQVPFLSSDLRGWIGPRATEIYQFADLLEYGMNSSNINGIRVGSRSFFAADSLVHSTGQGWMSSVRTHSNRLLGSECVNEEGKLSGHLADGSNYLYKHGREYYDSITGYSAFPVWNWEKIPGTTVQHNALPLDCNNVSNINGIRSFAGGVQDIPSRVGPGDFVNHGVDWSAPQGQTLHVYKSWHYFSNLYVAMGTNISTKIGTPYPLVYTTVDQRILLSSVYTSINGINEPLPINSNVSSPMPNKVNDYVWVWHDSVGYILVSLSNDNTGITWCISNMNQTGTWESIGAFYGTMTVPIFSLGYEHDTVSNNNGGYLYIVVPIANDLPTFVNSIPTILTNLQIIPNNVKNQNMVHTIHYQYDRLFSIINFPNTNEPSPIPVYINGGSTHSITLYTTSVALLFQDNTVTNGTYSFSYSNPSHTPWTFRLDIDRSFGSSSGNCFSNGTVVDTHPPNDGSSSQIVCTIGTIDNP